MVTVYMMVASKVMSVGALCPLYSIPWFTLYKILHLLLSQFLGLAPSLSPVVLTYY